MGSRRLGAETRPASPESVATVVYLPLHRLTTVAPVTLCVERVEFRRSRKQIAPRPGRPPTTEAPSDIDERAERAERAERRGARGAQYVCYAFGNLPSSFSNSILEKADQ